MVTIKDMMNPTKAFHAETNMDSIMEAYRQEFKKNLQLVLQQKTSKLRGCCTQVIQNSESDYYGKISTVPIREIAGFYTSGEWTGTTGSETPPSGAYNKHIRPLMTPLQAPIHTRRQCSINRYDWGTSVNGLDIRRLGVDPSSQYVESAKAALNRGQDVVVLNSLYSEVLEKKVGESATIASKELGKRLPIFVALDGVNASILAKIRARLGGFADLADDDAYFVCDSWLVEKLLSDPQISSRDYNTTLVLTEGKINTFCGFKFIQLSDGILPALKDSETDTNKLAADNKQIKPELVAAKPHENLFLNPYDKDFNQMHIYFVFTKKSVIFAHNGEIRTRFEENPMTSYDPTLYCDMYCGAMRLHDEGVAVILDFSNVGSGIKTALETGKAGLKDIVNMTGLSETPNFEYVRGAISS